MTRAASHFLGAGALFALTLLPLSAQDQSAPPPPPPPPPDSSSSYAQPPAPPPSAPDQSAQLSPLEQLVSPVALYPDPLLALVFPASTEPGQIQRAASYLNVGWQPDQLAGQPWIQPVKDLAHYPDVLRWMATNVQWTQQLGAAFASQPQQTMAAVQDLRHRALAAGTLQSNGQVQVVQNNGAVQILPAQPQVLYVPQYNPYAVYFPGEPDNYVVWGAAYPCGPWLGFYPDWAGGSIWVGDWYGYSLRHGGWAIRVGYGPFSIALGHVFRAGVWHVPPGAEVWRYHFDFHNGYALARPRMYPGAPGRDRYYDDHGRPYYDDHGRPYDRGRYPDQRY